jgi:hypothetical protein
MSVHGLLLSIGLSLLLTLPGPAAAADLPLRPAPSAAPASPAKPAPSTTPAQTATPPGANAGGSLAPPTAACLEWSDGCRTCQRPTGGEIACSNVGIACVPKQNHCTRQ